MILDGWSVIAVLAEAIQTKPGAALGRRQGWLPCQGRGWLTAPRLGRLPGVRQLPIKHLGDNRRMSGLTLAEVLDGTGGRILGDLADSTVFPRIQLDPVQVRAGDLYLAVPGEQLDGHELVPIAALRGAAAAVVAGGWAATVEQLALPLIVVDDPVAALQGLAAARRNILSATVVAITGSVGKTSTKELTAAVLRQRFRTYRNPGNRNNELGVPLSLLEVETGAEGVVLELGGGYAAGELELLAGIARPAVAVVTNVHPVHLERMGSLNAIARTKAELVQALPPEGIAILNGDDPRVRAMAEQCRGRVVTYGLGAENDVRAVGVHSRGLAGSSFDVVTAEGRRHVDVPFPGPHAYQLVLAAFAVGRELGMELSEMLPALDDRDLELRLRIRSGPNGSTLVDDTYNASPPAVLSALQLLEESAAERRIAVLGDMRELGSLSDREHRRVGRRAAEVVDLLITYGDEARTIAEEADGHEGGPKVVQFATDERQELVELLQRELREGDLVLLKGSRALGLDRLVERLDSTSS
jgi:UDP-N-acetylmuramoyl-tripeptide--D-alanyl-D-alanine ligase